MTLRSCKFIWRVAVPAILFLGNCAGLKASILLSSPVSTVAVGSTFEVDVRASDLNLGGYQLNIGFDPLLASLSSISFDQFLGSPLSFNFGQQFIDTIELDEVSFADAPTLLALQGDGASGNQFPLAKLTFLAEQAGTVEFTFLSPVLTDLTGNPVTTDFLAGRVTITDIAIPATVPEPDTWASVAICVGALVLIRRRRGARAQRK